jgi:hypothetical protein
VVVQQFEAWRGQIRREPEGADVNVVDVVEVGLLGPAVTSASSEAEPEHGPKEPGADGRVANCDSGVIDAEEGAGTIGVAPFTRYTSVGECEEF